MFIAGLDLSYKEASGVEHILRFGQIGLWIVSVRFVGSNIEHMSSYLFSYAGVYAKHITKLSEYNFNGKSSVLVQVNEDGAEGLKITATYASLNGDIAVTAKRII